MMQVKVFLQVQVIFPWSLVNNAFCIWALFTLETVDEETPEIILHRGGSRKPLLVGREDSEGRQHQRKQSMLKYKEFIYVA